MAEDRNEQRTNRYLVGGPTGMTDNDLSRDCFFYNKKRLFFKSSQVGYRTYEGPMNL
jgi:hypothetical protein